MINSYQINSYQTGLQRIVTQPNSNSEARGHVRALRRAGWRRFSTFRSGTGMIFVTGWWSPSPRSVA